MENYFKYVYDMDIYRFLFRDYMYGYIKRFRELSRWP